MNRKQLINRAIVYCHTESVSHLEWRALVQDLLSQMEMDESALRARQERIDELTPPTMTSEQIVEWARDLDVIVGAMRPTPIIKPAPSNE